MEKLGNGWQKLFEGDLSAKRAALKLVANATVEKERNKNMSTLCRARTVRYPGKILDVIGGCLSNYINFLGLRNDLIQHLLRLLSIFIGLCS